MPLLSKPALFERVRIALQSAGWGLVFDSAEADHPFRISIFKESDSVALTIYIWNLTHGGGEARPADEYRIQVTGITPPLSIEADRRTLLLGWSEDFGAFAAFDPLRHQTFSVHSPSIQIQQSHLQTAAENGGMSFYARGNGEIAVAVSPEALADYALRQSALHGYGDLPAHLDVLEAAATGETLNPEDVAGLPEERQSVVAQVSRIYRDSSFRRRVLLAYGNSCAACGTQLSLLDAAHIVPVPTPGSTDETNNGLALCAIHHRGYDAALLAVAPDYQVLLGTPRRTQLEASGLGAGWDRFSQVLDSIIVPGAAADRPHPEYLARAIEIRRFAA